MTIPIPGTAESAGRVADELDTRFGALYAGLVAFRASVATGTISGEVAEQNYQRVSSLRTFVTARVAANADAIGDAYKRNYPTHQGGTYVMATEWGATKAGFDAFISGFKSSWPEKTANGHPAFRGFIASGPNADELQSLPITLTAPQRTALLGLIDGITATLTPT